MLVCDSNSMSMLLVKVLLDCVDVDLLVDCQIWLATHPEAQNDFYNISNGDIFRFQQVRYQLRTYMGYMGMQCHNRAVTFLNGDTLARSAAVPEAASLQIAVRILHNAELCSVMFVSYAMVKGHHKRSMPMISNAPFAVV